LVFSSIEAYYGSDKVLEFVIGKALGFVTSKYLAFVFCNIIDTIGAFFGIDNSKDLACAIYSTKLYSVVKLIQFNDFGGSLWNWCINAI